MASSFGPCSWHISSVEELMALAEAQERRAAARYDQLAARMDRFGSPETATLFRQLASHGAGARRGLVRLGQPGGSARGIAG